MQLPEQYRNYYLICKVIFSCIGVVPCGMQATHRVAIPVANLVARPHVVYEKIAPVGPLETPELSGQLLYNEVVHLLKTAGEWSLVAVPAQKIITPQGLKPLQGWVQSSSLHPLNPALHTLPFAGEGTELVCVHALTPVFKKTQESPRKFVKTLTFAYETRLHGIAQEASWWRVLLADGTEGYVPAPAVTACVPRKVSEVRTQLVRHARQFLGSPYCWGGMSSFDASCATQLTGFDCSGLIYRLYKACNILVPRNSRAQYRQAIARAPAELEAGDLLFLARPAGSNRIVHVMLYTGEETFIEAWMERASHNVFNVQPLHEVSTKTRLGKLIKDIAQGETCGEYSCFGATFLPQARVVSS